MIKLRHQQPSLWHRGLAEDIEGLWEPWMRLVDELLEEEQLLDDPMLLGFIGLRSWKADTRAALS